MTTLYFLFSPEAGEVGPGAPEEEEGEQTAANFINTSLPRSRTGFNRERTGPKIRVAPPTVDVIAMAMATAKRKHVDKPEPRWQALLGLLAVVGTTFALPRWLSIAPRWILPILILLLLVPTVFAHRTGHHSLNHILGSLISGIITLSLMSSVVLLVTTLPAHKEAPLRLLLSGAALWLSNVLVFALWYWRLDDGGPQERAERGRFGSRGFVFPQMQVEQSQREAFGIDGWRPGFVDYLFVAFTTSSTFGPTDAPILQPWAKLLAMLQAFISLTIVVLLISR
ncbi:MAG: hypothetical protein ABIR29_11440, partial [Chthoniobacterales bacterium]